MNRLDRIYFITLITCTILVIYQFKTFTTGKPLRDLETRKCATKMIQNALEDKRFYQEVIRFFGINGFPTIKIKYMISNLLPCVNSNPMFLNNNSKEAVGYVMPRYSSKYIFINGDYWYSMSLYEKAETLIHECTHLVLNTEDYAYDHDVSFLKLDSKKALKNADTIKQIIVELSDNKC